MHGVARLRAVLPSLLVLAASTVLVIPASAAAPRNDYLLVLDRRAGPYHYLESFGRDAPDAYSLALEAFGTPSRFRVDGNLCRVTWKGSGITIGFASDLRPCRAASLFSAAWYGMSLWGGRWHNRVGIRVGDTVARVRELYPNARADYSLDKPWLILARRRVDEFNFVTLAVAVNRAGRVVSIEVPAAYIY